jgi:hypothetical protein
MKPSRKKHHGQNNSTIHNVKQKGFLMINLLEIANDETLLEIGRKAIEDALIEMRDSRISQPHRANGLVCREKNGTTSDVIRFGPETALRVGLQAIANYLEMKNSTKGNTFTIETNKFANQQDAQKAVERLTTLYDDNGNQLIEKVSALHRKNLD